MPFFTLDQLLEKGTFVIPAVCVLDCRHLAAQLCFIHN